MPNDNLLDVFNSEEMNITSWGDATLIFKSWVDENDYERIYSLAENEIKSKNLK